MNIVLSAINIFLSLLEYSVILECLCSWLPQTQNSGILAAFRKINGPFVNPFRKLMDKIAPGLPLDFSPLLLIVIIGVIKYIL